MKKTSKILVAVLTIVMILSLLPINELETFAGNENEEVVLYENADGFSVEWEKWEDLSASVSNLVTSGTIKVGTKIIFYGECSVDLTQEGEYQSLAVINDGWTSIIDGTTGNDRTVLKGLKAETPVSLVLSSTSIDLIKNGGFIITGHGWKIKKIAYVNQKTDLDKGETREVSLYEDVEGCSVDWAEWKNISDDVKYLIAVGIIKADTKIKFYGECTVDLNAEGEYQSLAVIDKNWTSLIDGSTGNDRTVLKGLTAETPVTFIFTENAIKLVKNGGFILSGHGWKIKKITYSNIKEQNNTSSPESKPVQKEETSVAETPKPTEVMIDESKIEIQIVENDKTGIVKEYEDVVKSSFNLSVYKTLNGFNIGLNKSLQKEQAKKESENKNLENPKDQKTNSVSVYTEYACTFNKKTAEICLNSKLDIILFFNHKGHLYKVTIPAGTDVSNLLDENGFAGPLWIGKELGTYEILK